MEKKGPRAIAVKVAEEVVAEGPALGDFERIARELRSLNFNIWSSKDRLIHYEIQGLYHRLADMFEKTTIKVFSNKGLIEEFRINNDFARKLAHEADPKKIAEVLLNEPKVSIEKIVVNPKGGNAGIAEIRIEGVNYSIFGMASFAEEFGKRVYTLYN